MSLNHNLQAHKGYVDRWVNIEMEARSATEEAKEAKKDLKAEIEMGFDATGVAFADVAKAAKSRLNKKTLMTRKREIEAEIELMDMLGFGVDAI